MQKKVRFCFYNVNIFTILYYFVSIIEKTTLQRPKFLDAQIIPTSLYNNSKKLQYNHIDNGRRSWLNIFIIFNYTIMMLNILVIDIFDSSSYKRKPLKVRHKYGVSENIYPYKYR